MNRHEEFNQSEFKKAFDQIIKILEEIDTNRITDSQAKRKFLRIKKVFNYIANYISIIDWDLLIPSQWDGIVNKFQILNEIITRFKQYAQEFNSNSLTGINTQLDNDILPVFQNILQKVNLPKKVNLKSVYEDYTKTLNQLLTQINEKKLLEKNNEIEQYYSELFDETEEEHSIKSEIEELKNNIKTYHSELFDGKGDENGIKEQINNETESILTEIEKIRKRITESSDRQDKLNNFYVKIFGKLNEETKQREGGLNHQLESDQAKFKAYKDEQEKAIEKIKTDIKHHMENAMSVGLAKAFNREAQSLKISVRLWTASFAVTLTGLFLLAVDAFNLSNLFTDPELNWPSMLKNLPITLPLIWLAVFIGKRRSENNRLYHEYLHKEVVANSYSSYKQQIEELSEDRSKELLDELLSQTVKIIGKNPSETLDKKHSANLPIKEITDPILDKKKSKVNHR